MNHSKQLLSYVRQGDFAHPGEIEAIELAMKPIVKNKMHRMLDVGCGLGGTAHYLQKQGWGNVIGVDVDADLIQHATEHYSDISFIQGDILQGNTFLNQTFHVIYCFSAFFCFEAQQTALSQMFNVAENECDLVIFDYSRPNARLIDSPFPWSKTASRFNPIYLPEIKGQLQASGWHFKDSQDISHQFERWYACFLQQFEIKREGIISRFGETMFSRMYEGYSQLLRAIRENRMGGVIIYATKYYSNDFGLI